MDFSCLAFLFYANVTSEYKNIEFLFSISIADRLRSTQGEKDAAAKYSKVQNH